MVLDTKVSVAVHFDTESIVFCDSETREDIFIDCSGIPGPSEKEPNHEGIKTDLCQHFLLQHLERNGTDCRPLSRLLGGDNLDRILPLAAKMHMGEKDKNVEERVRSLHRLLGQMISMMMEQRDHARQKLVEAKVEDEMMKE